VAALLALAFAGIASAAPRIDGRWSTWCPTAARREPPSCVTSFSAPEVEIAVRMDKRAARIEVRADARDPFSGERCEWWRSMKLPEGRIRTDAAALARRLNQNITLMTFECRPAVTPELDRSDGEHLIRFLAEARSALAAQSGRR
jgi:hypothetical protein